MNNSNNSLRFDKKTVLLLGAGSAGAPPPFSLQAFYPSAARFLGCRAEEALPLLSGQVGVL